MFELKKWEPLRDLSTIQREMDDLFRRVFGGFSTAGLFKRETRAEWCPDVDCFMKEGSLVVHADIPGMEPKDVDISIAGNVLTIRGERKAEWEEKKEGYLFHEASYGSFSRSLTLPEGVDTTKVHASYRNGVIELTMPAKAEALPKKVKIEVEGAKEGKKAA
jgi:HSP20 family protein